MKKELLEWLRKQSDAAPPPEIEAQLPKTNFGRKDNKPVHFHPNPNRAAVPTHWETYSIWDKIVTMHDRERDGLKLSFNGGRVEELDVLELDNFDGFTVVLAGGDEMHFWKKKEGEQPTAYASTNRTSSFLRISLKPYGKDPEFFESIEGPLLVTMYVLRRKGVTATEIRLQVEP